MTNNEPVVATDTDKETKSENACRKRVRHRKKMLYEKILKQMEFYFSDANLSKDRFLGQLLKDDPFISLEVFLKFNKIRSMTNDFADIAKAMKNSNLLELSEDKTKVRRKTPFVEYDSDSRTVYVECIPVSASREWLERLFSEYGQVAYISLPKFKDSQRLKGFGFIEFAKPEEAQKCLDAFTKMGCKLETTMPPEELSSIKTFAMEPFELKSEETTFSETDEPPKKKKKVKDKKGLKNIDDIDLNIENSKKEDIGEEELSKNSRKRRKRKKSHTRDTETATGAQWGLQVLGKREWKRLRNKYLELQRKNAKAARASRFGPVPAAPAPAPAPIAPSHVRFEDDEPH